MKETTKMETKIEDQEVKSEEETEKSYTFRELKSKDLFLMSKIISKIGVNEFTACFEKDGIKKMIASMTGKSDEDENVDFTSVVGISVILEIANVILGNLPKCEKEIIQMLSSVSGMSYSKVENLGMVTFVDMIVEFIKKEEFKDFIKVVSKLLK